MPVYRYNLRSESKRRTKFAPTVAFGAANDSAAAAVEAAIDDVTAAQIVRRSKRVYENDLKTNHPEGSRFTASATCIAENGAVKKYLVRNLKSAATSDDIARLFKGTGPSLSGIQISALAGEVHLPGADSQITTVQALKVDKS